MHLASTSHLYQLTLEQGCGAYHTMIYHFQVVKTLQTYSLADQRCPYKSSNATFMEIFLNFVENIETEKLYWLL